MMKFGFTVGTEGHIKAMA